MFRKLSLCLITLFLLASCGEDPVPTFVPLVQSIATTTSTAPAPVPTHTPPSAPSTTTPNTPTPASTASNLPVATSIPSITIVVSHAGTNELIVGATIGLRAEYLHLTLSQVTNERGEVFFINLAPGDYPLTVETDTFAPVSTITTIASGENLVHINLSTTRPSEMLGYVNQSRSDLYSAPSNTADVLEQLAIGTTLTVFGRTEDGNWLFVEVVETELTGWLAIDLVEIAADLIVTDVVMP